MALWSFGSVHRLMYVCPFHRTLPDIYSIEGIDPAQVECSYSPAKRRGPTPGRFSHTDGLTSPESAHHGLHPQSDVVMMNSQNNVNRTQQHGMHDLSSSSNMTGVNNLQDWLLTQHQQTSLNNGDMMNAVTSNSNLTGNGSNTLSSLTQQQQQLAAAALMLAGSANGTAGVNGGGNSMVGLAPASNDPSTIQHHLNLLQQQIQQRQQQLLLAQQLQQQQQQLQATSAFSTSDVGSAEPTSQRRRMDEGKKLELPNTILTHTHMLDRGDPDGSRLRAYYRLSIDEMFRLPCTPSDEEYCSNSGRSLVGRHLAALSASRFAETALGAIVNNEITLAMELCNAVVHCLREAVEEQLDSTIVFEIAKAYFLLGVFRSIRGDMVRYFKYRRVALSYVAKLKVR